MESRKGRRNGDNKLYDRGNKQVLCLKRMVLSAPKEIARSGLLSPKMKLPQKHIISGHQDTSQCVFSLLWKTSPKPEVSLPTALEAICRPPSPEFFPFSTRKASSQTIHLKNRLS